MVDYLFRHVERPRHIYRLDSVKFIPKFIPVGLKTGNRDWVCFQRAQRMPSSATPPKPTLPLTYRSRSATGEAGLLHSFVRRRVTHAYPWAFSGQWRDQHLGPGPPPRHEIIACLLQAQMRAPTDSLLSLLNAK